MKLSGSKLKSQLKLIAIDILIVLIGAVGAIYCGYLFIQDINATLTRQGEQPVGAIVSRYNIVQRRFSNRLAWDRLFNNSPVYNGDIIRTSNLSEATISFDHGDEISLFSNTLVQVFIDSEGNRIDFSAGELIINTPEISRMEQAIAESRQGSRRRRDSGDTERLQRSMVINTGDQRVRVERGSAIRLASLDDGDLELTVNEGTVILEESPEEPATQRRRRNQENAEQSIFSERPERPEGAERRRRSETTETAGSERTERQRRAERSDSSDNTENSERPSRPERALIINTGEQRIRTERRSSIRIDSQDGELELTVNEGTATLESTVTNETESVETGRRVRVNRQDSRRESNELSETDELEPTERTRRERPEGERQLLPSPRNRIPADQHTITAQMIIDSQALAFSWDSVRDANGYILTIFRDNEGFRSTLLETPILTDTSYTIENIRRYRGNLYWQVEAVRVSENGSIEIRGRLRENSLIVDIPRREIGSERTGAERVANRERPRRSEENSE